MRFAFVDAEKASYPVATLCRALDVSRSGFYAWRSRPESSHSKADRSLGVLIERAFFANRGVYGSPRIYEELKANDQIVSRKRVARLMAEKGLRGRTRKRFRATTNSDHCDPVSANILDRNFTPSSPNQVWAGDTTELRTPSGGRLFLAVVLDLFSRFVVGWSMGPNNDSSLVVAALRSALRTRQPPGGVLHHSDRGSPYTGEAYQRLLRENGLVASMSRKGNCWDNAVVESFFSTLKLELGEVFENSGTARSDLFDFIEVFYNRKRRHSSIGYRSPAEHEKVAEAQSAV